MASINALKQSSETKDNLPELETTDISAKSRKSSFFLNPTADSSNELIQLLLSELKEMRMEIKEIKEDGKEHQKRLEEIGENQKKLQEEVLKVQNDVTGIKKSLEEVPRKQTNQGQMLHESKLSGSSNVNEIKKEEELYCETDIRRQINGKWRDVNDHDEYFSAKFEGDTFMQKLDERNSYDKYTIGVEDPNGCCTVENNKIVQRGFTDQGEEIIRLEYSIENERLQIVCYEDGEETFKVTYERYANPDPE